MTLNVGQFALDGYTFGGGPGAPVRVVEFSPGDRTVITRDQRVAGMLGRHLGADDIDAPEWTWALAVEDGVDAELFDAFGRLAAAWAPTHTRWLRYALPGRARRVWGRTRRFRPSDVVWWDGVEHLPVDATFQLQDPRSFDDVERSLDLSLVPPTGPGGLVAPFTAPFTMSGEPRLRAGQVVSRGDAPSPVVVTFRGPISSPWVRGDGWEIGLTGSLAYDVSVVVDAVAGTVTRSDGASVAGRLTRGTRLREAVIRPGLGELLYGGSDVTGTARATVSWRDAWWSL